MKDLTKFIILMLLIVTFTSCSDDSSDKQTYIYESEKLNLTELINIQSPKIARNLNKNVGSDFIHSEFETTFYMPDGLSENKIENLVAENQNQISGTLKYFINDNKFVEINIVDGVKVGHTNYSEASFFSFFQSDSYPLRHVCSYDGIQDCVQYAVYEQWSTYTALKCSFTGGLACIADEVASCIESNCL